MKKLVLLLFATMACSKVLGQDSEIKYELGLDSKPQKGVPQGQVTTYDWESEIIVNTIREYYVYVPAQYDGKQPAALMIFQDGHAYIDPEGSFRVPTVFDNLIHQGDMPITIGLFITPGHRAGFEKPSNWFRAENRSFEYDDMTDQYATFLIEEMIPELEKTYNISKDPKMRAIAGLSSGGICAFTAAWQRPDHFHKVMSHIGSFTNIRGGHVYPAEIRKSAKKDIKVFLQDGKNDLDLVFGNWWLANLQMESALKFKGYEVKFVAGEGGHSGEHGGAILPESLRWLWSDVVD
jgi:enterochelin esterase-like enzyme